MVILLRPNHDFEVDLVSSQKSSFVTWTFSKIRIGIGSCDLFAKLLQILTATGGGIDQISEGS